ncbi:MAG: amino acid adenylation domain-containing protein [Actinophytocola sp.]|uniref:amino acid adenylation domain-containing protein n=1 Tax=Actinophytocola sp. TaxID=1872138 RepID=UPI003C71672F
MSAGLVDLFAEQVRARPDAVAVESAGAAITYRELHDRAARVAAGLAELGVGPETLVGMAFERSPDAIVAMLGIVFAGGAYVPLNPAFPAARIAALIDDSRVRVVLCDDHGAATVRAAVRAAAPDDVLVRSVAEFAAKEGVLVPVPPSALAYVMYTSGSTGRPKGVLVERRGIVRLAARPGYVDITPDDRFLHMSALEFDASTWEIWGALLSGARVCVVDRETSLVPQRLGAELRERGVTVAWLTSALCNQLVDEDVEIFAPLRTLLTGGDVLSPRHMRLLRARHPGLAVHNGYGPTENTTFTTTYRIDDSVDGPVPIGYPIPGTTVAVLDERRRPVPVGAAGELYTGGAGLARGYLNNEELTRERFVVIDGERYYRTGDTVHADADGLLHFHGRTDDQVKIRGQRVEVGEVTAALLAVPGVTDACVRVAGEAENKRLVGYVVATGMAAAGVRGAMAARVPGYLVPDQLLTLPRLPLNANGKVDVRALPEPTAEPAAHTPAEEALAELWGAVLGVDPATIPADASFTEIGGNSITLGVLIGRIGRQLGVELTFADAFAAPTLAAMAATVASAGHAVVAPIPPVTDGAAVALHPQQVGMYALWQVDPGSLAYNIPVRVTIRGPLDVARLNAAFRALVARHDALRMRFTLTEHGVRQAAAPVTAELACPPELPEDVVADFVRPFLLDQPPLIRGLVAPTGPGTHELYLDAHHIVMDGISLRVLLAELFDRYEGREPGTPAVSYAAAARWSRDRRPDPAHETFWRAELAGAPAGLDLPTDRPRGRTRAMRGAVTTRTVDTARVAELDRVARRLGTTTFAVLLAAWTATLARVSGQRDLVVGTPVSGRTHPDLDSVAGMFVSTVCLRARIDDPTSLGELAVRLGRSQIDALTHQDFPFERLVEALGVPRDPARNPLFDTLFAYQDLGFHEFATEDLDASVDLVNPGTTRFDLNLQVHRRPGRLVLDLEHATDLYDTASADYLLGECVTALTELADGGDAPVFTPARVAVSVSAADFTF